MARISLEPKPTLLYRITRWLVRRRYGDMLDPVAASGHNSKVMRTMGKLEVGAERWDAVDGSLKGLAVLATSARTGCSWCTDFGYWENHRHGVAPAKLRNVAHWRDTDVYTSLERRVMAYSEAMTATPPQVTDEMVAELLGDLSESELVELTAMIGIENMRNRINSALGLTGQGFKDRCEVPVP